MINYYTEYKTFINLDYILKTLSPNFNKNKIIFPLNTIDKENIKISIENLNKQSVFIYNESYINNIITNNNKMKDIANYILSKNYMSYILQNNYKTQIDNKNIISNNCLITNSDITYFLSSNSNYLYPVSLILKLNDLNCYSSENEYIISQILNYNLIGINPYVFKNSNFFIHKQDSSILE